MYTMWLFGFRDRGRVAEQQIASKALLQPSVQLLQRGSPSGHLSFVLWRRKARASGPDRDVLPFLDHVREVKVQQRWFLVSLPLRDI